LSVIDLCCENEQTAAARDNLTAMTGTGARLREVIVVALALHACFTVAVPVLLVLMARRMDIPFFSSPSLRLIGALLGLAGIALYVRAVYELAVESGTSAVPLGTPERLRTEGVFSRVRNPALLGVVVILIGEALAAGQPVLLAYALIDFTALHVFVTRVEEPALEKRFGAEYRRYRAGVPRWLPRVRSDR
jgi:protein-S-isoprenylcysteine O-methyltransferase Ste14